MAKTPRNLRQVGEPRENLSIYIEDYVYTYLRGEYNTEAAILIGESCYEENGISVFIRGVISCPQLYWREEGMEMTVRTWNHIFREREHLYPNQEIVGWYLPIPSGDEEQTLVALGEFHGRHFPGADKVFFYLDMKHGEEAFYVKDGPVFKRQSGYYVFYEKNTTMRQYMLALREERQLEADLYKEVHDKPREQMRYREYIHAELEKKQNNEGVSSYIMGAVALVAVLVLAFGMISGYRELNGLGDFFAAVDKAIQANIQGNEENDETESLVAGSPVENDSVGNTDDATQNGESTDNPAGVSDEDSENGEGSSGDNADGDANDETDELNNDSQEDASIIEGTQFDTTVDETDTEIAMALAQGYYVVKQGEGLSEICRKLYGSDDLLETICELNDIENPDTIYPGQIIYLP